MADSQPTHAVSGEQLNESSVEYRDISGFPGYRVGNDGSVWSQKYGDWRKLSTVNRTHYPSVSLQDASKRRITKNVHALVAEAFIGPRPEGQQCCHKNGIRSDCRADNLRWGTAVSNAADKRLHGTAQIGETNPFTHLTDADVIVIRQRIADGERLGAVARDYGVGDSAISGIVLRKTWSHVGGAEVVRVANPVMVERRDRIVEYLRESGPQSAPAIASRFDLPLNKVWRVLQQPAFCSTGGYRAMWSVCPEWPAPSAHLAESIERREGR